MADSSSSELTTRSLLKGILATEPERTAVKNRSKKRVSSQASTSYAHQNEPSSPSFNLRSKMKDRVRRSLGKSALEASVIKRNVEANSKMKTTTTKKGSHPVMEGLDEMTPRILLKKIIQHEDEVSMIVSQRANAAADGDKNQENTSPERISSMSSVNLSLPDFQETENVTVFRKAREKRKLRVSEFEREVDGRLPKNVEDEESVIVVRRTKLASDDKRENTPAKLSSMSSVNLSLPDFQEPERITGFRKTGDKRKLRVSEFEREVDGRLPKNEDDFDAPALLVSSYRMSGSNEHSLEFSAAPETTLKRGLLRRPKKVYVVSLDDFEKGVEDKYQLLKGSQECFVEAAEGDKSDSSSNEVAEKNTELYAQPPYKDTNTSNLGGTLRGASMLLASTFDERKGANDEFLETESRKPNADVHSIFNIQSSEENAYKGIGENRGKVSDDGKEDNASVGSSGSEVGDDDIEVEASDDTVEVNVAVDDEADDSDDDVDDNASDDTVAVNVVNYEAANDSVEEDVVAATAEDDVVAAAAEDDVVAAAAEDDVVAAAAEEDVVAAAAEEDVVAAAAEEDVVAAAAEEDVVAAAAEDDVVAAAAEEDVVAAAAEDDVVAAAAEDDVVAAAAEDDVVVASAEDDVVAAAAEDDVVAAAAEDDVVAAAAEDDVVAAAAEDDVVAAAAEDDVVATAAEDDVVAAAAEDDDVAGAAEDDDVEGAAEDDDVEGAAEDDDDAAVDDAAEDDDDEAVDDAAEDDDVDYEAVDDAAEDDDVDYEAVDDDEAADEYRDVGSNVQQNKSSSTNNHKKSTGDNEYSLNVQHTRHSDKYVMPTAKSIHLHTMSASRPEESYETSESSDEENLNLARSAVDRGMAKKKEKNQLLLSALPETPSYFKKTHVVIPTKPAISQKIQRTKSTKPKKEKSVFTKSQIKQMFSHHAQMRVTKEALVDVEKCLDVYLGKLTADLSAYTAHANRKTIMRADLELLLKRQRLVTDTTSLNVLIEKHLPMDCRRLLIPCATSKNEVFPKL